MDKLSLSSQCLHIMFQVLGWVTIFLGNSGRSYSQTRIITRIQERTQETMLIPGHRLQNAASMPWRAQQLRDNTKTETGLSLSLSSTSSFLYLFSSISLLSSLLSLLFSLSSLSLTHLHALNNNYVIRLFYEVWHENIYMHVVS